MKFTKYQNKSKKTAVYDVGNDYIYPLLGLAGEVGEVSEVISKIRRDNNGFLTVGDKLVLKSELGDVLWYLTQLASELGLSLEDIAITNLEKLKNRQEEGTLRTRA